MNKIVLFLVVLFSQSASAQEVTIGKVFSFPIKAGDEQWRRLGNTHERIAALQIPIKQLEMLTTEELLDVCLNFPYLTSMAFCNDYQNSVELLVSQFNGLQELVNRKDIILVLLNKERNMIKEYEKIASYSLSERGLFSYQWLFVDLLFIQKDIKSHLNEKHLTEFNSIYLINQSFRSNHPEDFEGMYSISESLLYKNGVISGNNNRFNYQYEDVTIYTPNGTNVPGAKILSGDDITISPTMEAQLRAHLISVYDSAQVLDPGSYKYDIAGWTWHTSVTGEKVVIPYNNDVVYRSDGSYIQVPEQLATRVIYGNNLFSATIDSPNWYISKWGIGGPLVRHHPTSLPNGTDTYWSPDNPNYYPLAQRTYYMRNPNCSIIGQGLIASGYIPYYVHNLPPGCTVSWSLDNSYYSQHCLITLSNTNTCYIYHDNNYDMMGATLTATVKYNNVVILTENKTVYSYEGFWGQYTSGNLSGNINYTCFFNIKANNFTTIFSPNFYDATVSYDSSGAIPSSWSHNPNSGVVSFYTTNTSAPVIINVHDCCGNDYVLYAYPSSLYSINASNGVNGITVTLVEEGNASKDFTPDQSWTIEVRSAATGELMTTLSSISRSETISTVGWPKGVYIIKVTIGKEELTEKVIVK